MEINLKDEVQTVQETISVEKHNYVDKKAVAPCDSDDKECHQRWIQAFCDCE